MNCYSLNTSSSFRWLLLLPVIALVIAITGSQPLAAQSPINNPAACDGMLDDTLSELRLRMAEHWLMYGSPWQGLPTHSTPPSSPTVPDRLAFSPSDQPLSWADFAGDVLPSEMPCSLQIDVFDMGEQRGYTITASYTSTQQARTVDGKTFVAKQGPPGRVASVFDRVVAIGPGAKSQDWHRRPDPPGHTK